MRCGSGNDGPGVHPKGPKKDISCCVFRKEDEGCAHPIDGNQRIGKMTKKKKKKGKKGKGKKKGKKKDKGKKGKSWGERRFSLRIWFRDYTLQVSALLTILFIIMIVFGGLSLFAYDKYGDSIPEPIDDWVASLHGANDPDDPKYDLCLFPIGGLLVMFSGWYLGDAIVKRRQFEKMLDSESKSEFLENLDELEEMAWKLSSKHEMRVMDKKEELGLKRKRRR